MRRMCCLAPSLYVVCYNARRAAGVVWWCGVVWSNVAQCGMRGVCGVWCRMVCVCVCRVVLCGVCDVAFGVVRCVWCVCVVCVV